MGQGPADLAAAVHALVQGAPQSPTEAGIATAIKEAFAAPADEADDISDFDFGLLRGPNGERLDIHFTNERFAALFQLCLFLLWGGGRLPCFCCFFFVIYLCGFFCFVFWLVCNWWGSRY